MKGWDFFEKIFCISLVQRPDRRAEAKHQFDRIGLGEKVEFLMVDRHPTNPEAGIYESHLICIRKGLDAGAEFMAIFEDDILFDRYDPGLLADCIDFMSRSRQWNAFFWGCLVNGSRKTGHRHIIEVKYRSLSHAYALNRRFAEVLIRRPYQGLAYDDYLKSLNKGYFSVHPCFAFQSASPSDNDKYLHLDRIRRLFGGLQRVQKWNEFYFRHRTAAVAVHLVLVLFLILWMF